MKKLKSTKKPNPYARKIVVPVKVNSEELREWFGKAGAWTEGNVSELIRAAVRAFKPSQKDFQK